MRVEIVQHQMHKLRRRIDGAQQSADELDKVGFGAALGDGGLTCENCTGPSSDAVSIAPATIVTFERLRSVSWEEALTLPLGRAESELPVLL